MPWNADTAIAKLNDRLNAALIRVTIRRKGNKLYLRGTFPPRPGSERSQPHQQDIALGTSASPEGLKVAEATAKMVSAQLDWGKFDWGPFLKKASAAEEPGETAGKYAEKAQVFYFNTRQSRAGKETWANDYQSIYDRLPWDAPLTEPLIIKALCQFEANSRSRQRAYNAFQFLIKSVAPHLSIAKIEPYRGNYSTAEIDPRSIPSDAEIERYRLQIANEDDRWAYSVLATYGLRPHELWHLDFTQFSTPPGILKISKNTKTGSRKIWPLLGKWWEEWEEWKTYELKTSLQYQKSGSNKDLEIYPIFAKYKIPFPPYTLRHAWAIRSAIAGISPSIAAKMMGHSLATHSSRYHAWMDESAMQQAWERANQQFND